MADAFEAFAGSVLDTGVPDYPAMLRDDLSDLGLSVAGVGAPAAPEGLHPAGVAYVVAGSRLGLASLRRDRFWGKSGGCASRYMTDDAGLNVWRAMAGWMRGARLPASEVSAICDSAVSVFALFEDGLVRSLPEHAG
ncbi:hypothetical protein [Novosphingobium marinum]|uniref:Heme oxygenase n=1 Tax=Novosphingobium marinum TaxID=1514948 RepID=A0A7Y9Y1D3_9SPHN|nr:hypothetical protein [Novosphingobium marinum]NYH96826.1 heme oxygenase [Novosphingobium marinum]